MMKNKTILALETSTEMCSVALLHEGLVTFCEQFAPQMHAKIILPMIKKVLNERKIQLNQVNAIAFGRGPGSFTGVRIGVSIAKGLGFGAKIPLIPVSTLKILAEAGFQETKKSNILCAIDARMNEIYFGNFLCKNEGIIDEIGEEIVISPNNFLQLIDKKVNYFCAGTGFDAYPNLLKSSNLTKTQIIYPFAKNMISIACFYYEKNLLIDSINAEPVYIRNETTWKKQSEK